MQLRRDGNAIKPNDGDHDNGGNHRGDHGNSDGIESDLGDQSFSEDDQDITERVERRSPLGKIGKDPESRVNLEEYLNRSDTAVIYPEPVEDIDNDNTGMHL